MKIKILSGFIFLFFCNLIAKDLNVDLRGQIPDRSSIVMQCDNAKLNFTLDGLTKDQIYESIFSINFNTNIKSPF